MSSDFLDRDQLRNEHWAGVKFHYSESEAGESEEVLRRIAAGITPEGYQVMLCSCEVPHLGARMSGTPCCCEACGFMTVHQFDAIVGAAYRAASA